MTKAQTPFVLICCGLLCIGFIANAQQIEQVEFELSTALFIEYMGLLQRYTVVLYYYYYYYSLQIRPLVSQISLMR